MGLNLKSYFRGIIMLAPAIRDNSNNRYFGKKIL
jgi:hypothetical protein